MQAVPNNCAKGGSGGGNLFPTNHLENILLSALFHAKHKRLISLHFKFHLKHTSFVIVQQKKSDPVKTDITLADPLELLCEADAFSVF